MPIYEYECNKCSSRFDARREFSECRSAPCPICGSEGRRIYLPPPLHFKGSGFYVTDHRKKGGSGEEGSQPPKAGSDKPDVKPASGEAKAKPGPEKPAGKPE